MSTGELGEGTQGVWTRRQALRQLSRHEIAGLLRNGTWQAVHAGIYADGGYVLDTHQRAWAAVLASGGQTLPLGAATPDGGDAAGVRAVAAGRTAARCWGLPLVDDDDPATGAREHFVDDVRVWTGLADLRSGTGLELKRHRGVALPDGLVRTTTGLWLTSPLQTAVDCAGLLSHDATVCLLDAALHRGLVTADGLAMAAEQRGGSAGAVALRAAVAVADGRAGAPPETLARLLLRPVLPGLRPQVVLRDRRGAVVARFDLGDEQTRLAVETDGRRWHAGAEMVARDNRRDGRAVRLGWWTERATWYDVRRRQAELIERVLWRRAWWSARAG